MKLDAVVYTTHTGHTRRYAEMLGQKLGLPAYSLEEARSRLPRGGEIVYLGWIFASHIQGFSKASKRFSVRAACAVGLCDTGTLTEEVRKATPVPGEIPLFTLQGGLDRSRLTGVRKLMISMLTKGLASQKQRSPQDERMLELLSRDASYVDEENLQGVLEWSGVQP